LRERKDWRPGEIEKKNISLGKIDDCRLSIEQMVETDGKADPDGENILLTALFYRKTQ